MEAGAQPVRKRVSRDAKRLHVDPDRLHALLDFAIENESHPYRGDRPAQAKVEQLRQGLGPLADADIVGPFTSPGRANGLVLRHGRVVATFGDTSFVAEIASATKSFLSLLCGVAVHRGLIDDVDASVHRQTGLDLLASDHNREITWRHLLQQTSEWEGELFGKHPTGHRGERVGEPLRAPGAYWEYNDVRVNLLARALLEIFRRPLPDVLRREVTDPLGASRSWSWHGYETSGVDIDGRRLPSVSGGSHHCFVVPDHELVVVVRWIGDDAWPAFLDQALRLVTDAPPLGPVAIDWTQVNRPPSR